MTDSTQTTDSSEHIQQVRDQLVSDQNSTASFWRYMQFFSLVVVILMIGIGTIIFVLNQQVASQQERLALDNRLLADVNEMGQLATDLETGQRGYFLTGKSSYLEPFVKARARIKVVMGKIAGQLTTPESKLLFLRIQQSLDNKIIELDHSFELDGSKGREAAVEFIRSDVGKALMDDLRTDLQALRTHIGRGAFERMVYGGVNEAGVDDSEASFDGSSYDAAQQDYQRRMSTAPTAATAAANKAARDRLYAGLEGSVRDLNMGNLNTEFSTAGREVNFDAARRGLYGGSAYADQLGVLADKRNQGLLKITDAATGAANDARASDDRARLGLARDITSGLDESTALASASNQMDSNLTAARTNATAGSLSGFFDTVLNNLNRSAQQQGINSAYQKYGGAAMPRQAVTNGNLYPS